MRTIRRRRREGKTDYQARLSLLKSGKPRLVIRRTNRYILAQIIQSETAKDKVLVGVISKDLLSAGWPAESSGSLKNRTASYLTGYMLAKKALASGVKAAISDFGLHRNVHKSRIFSVVKGAIDAGLNVPCGKEALPEEKDLSTDKEMLSIISKVKTKLGGKNA